jgi:hypothetical protein
MISYPGAMNGGTLHYLYSFMYSIPPDRDTEWTARSGQCELMLRKG